MEKVVDMKNLTRGFNQVLAMTVAGLFLFMPTAHAKAASWTEKSNLVATEYTHFFAELYPELGSSFGMTEYDAKATGVVDDMEAKDRAGLKVWQKRLQEAIPTEKDANVKIDLAIMSDMVERSLEGLDLDDKLSVVPVELGSRSIYSNLFSLINPQSPAPRKRAAVDRFKAYVEGFGSYKPYLVAHEQRTRSLLSKYHGKPLRLPLKSELEKYLGDSPTYVQGVRKMLEESGRTDWEATFKMFTKQVDAYDKFLRTEILPQARVDFKMPPELYQFTLKSRGIDASAEWLIKQGRVDFDKVYKDFHTLGGVKRLQELKQHQLTKPKEVEALYALADKDLTEIITKHNLVTLPKIPLKIRLAGDAESKAAPVPHLNPPPIIGNTGERPEFVVPTSSTGKMPFDDFSYKEAAIVLTAHEGRPGHDLQFSSMLDGNVSLIRARYAFNNVNVEGWGLYAEDLVFPYLSKDQKLVALQTRLWRIARSFLDPEMQTGKAQPKDVENLFVNKLGVSPEMAKLEVERYTFQDPGQAPSYYYGLLKLRALRNKLGTTKGPGLKCFNDAVLSLGLLPMDKAEPLLQAAGCETASH